MKCERCEEKEATIFGDEFAYCSDCAEELDAKSLLASESQMEEEALKQDDVENDTI